MSQTETLLVLALGAAVTLLMVLLFGRMFWSMAMAAGSRRRAKQLPIEMLNLQADRDRLRAEHALMSRKLEMRLDDVKNRMAEQQAEVARSRNRVQSLMEDIQQRDDQIKKLERENGILANQLQLKTDELEAMAAAQNATEADVRKNVAELMQLKDAMQKLSTSLQNKEAASGQLTQELKRLVTPTKPQGPEKAPPTLSETEDRLRKRVAELTTISAEMARQPQTLDTEAQGSQIAEAGTAIIDQQQQERDQLIQKKLADAEHEAQEMQKELKQLDVLLAKANEAAGNQPAGGKKQGAMANVVSLAQRIKSLQRSMND